MVTFKKAGVLLSSAVLSVGLLAPVASASTVGVERGEVLPIVVAQANAKVSKADLIKRFREVFPKEFSYLSNKDFYMSTGYLNPNDKTMRYELYFTKDIGNDHVYGSALFVGDKLELEQFYYQPVITKDVLFPAKYSKDDAQKIADKFMKKLTKGEKYELIDNEFNYLSSSLLTEPIQYYFTYAKKNSDITIADQTISISVLGDGSVTTYYKSEAVNGTFTFDDVATIQGEEASKKLVQNALKADLAYSIDSDYRTGKQSVKLVYQPTNAIIAGLHAKTGQWLTNEGLSTTLPTHTVKPISEQPLPAKQPNLTEEQALAMAEELLTINRDDVELTIESIEETTTDTGKDVYDIFYSYEYKNGSTGGSFIIEKATGEVLNYDNLSYHLDEYEEEEPNLVYTQQQAYNKAVEYVKDWLPSYANTYALPPMNEELYWEYNNSYYFIFPRIVNGLQVNGDHINVHVDAETGELLSLYVNAYDNIDWPEPKDVISQKEATKIFKNDLKLNLQYINIPKVENDQHYSLVYQPVFKSPLSYNIDAKTGEWLDAFGRPYVDAAPIEHPTAEEELNYLIQRGVLKVDENFNPDAAISKEEALKVLLDSLTYMYYGIHDGDETEQAFDDVALDDDLHPYIAKALRMGMIDQSSDTFNAEASLTNEELAKWAIGSLKLERAAQYSNIYKLNYLDASKVDKKLRGHVALAYAMGLLEAENKKLKPKADVTYAQLAQVTIRLAHKMNEFKIDNY